MAHITLEGVTRSFPDGTVAVRELDLEIRNGEFMVLVGPSGSGKSTALRMIAGLEEVSAGTIRIGDRVVNDLPPRDRDIAMVFQNYALYPHMSVFDNMAFALKLRGVPKDEIRSRVEQAAELLSIERYLKRKPRQLSGGQRQRVAMGRAIVREPAAFLMDEPLSNLDAKLRVQMRREIASLHHRLGTTTVYVTHDQVEAVTMADRVAVLRDGILQQVDTPQNLYDNPVNLFVAGFIGSPAMNMVNARLDGDSKELEFGSFRIPLPAEVLERRKLQSYSGRDVVLGIRPEAFEDADVAGDSGTSIEVSISLVENLGAETVAYFEVDAPPVVTKDTLDLMADADRREAAVLASSNAAETAVTAGAGTSTMAARLSAKSRLRPGISARLVVDTSQLYFFDPESGESLGR